jgi:mediator of RNA polymerase II transcription subunit 28
VSLIDFKCSLFNYFPLITSNASDQNMSISNGFSNEPPLNLVSDFESSFESCFELMSNLNQGQVHDPDEVRTSVEQFIQKYLDSARTLEAYFLDKRLLLSNERPEQLLVEDLNEVRSEIVRKDQILNRLNEKFDNWIAVVSDPSATLGPPTQITTPVASNVSGHSPSVGMSPGMSVVPVRGPAGSPMQAMHSRAPHSSGPMITTPNAGMMATADSPMMQPFLASGPNTPIQIQPSTGNNLSGPLAYLERTTSNIGMPDSRR